jgi:hypothetical protein
MALPSAPHAPAPRQHETPHVGMQGPMHTPPKAAERALDPVLVEGIDPVLLHRLYPDADTIADAATQALAQGKKTMEEGAKLLAAQQEPVP